VPAATVPAPAPRTFSLARAAAAHAERAPAPAPGQALCDLPPHAVIALLLAMSITTEVAQFDTYAHPRGACLRSLAIAVERPPTGALVVNGLSYDGRPACFSAWTNTVLEVEEAPTRHYAAWILPEGGTLTSCPDSLPLSTLSRAQRTPRRPSASSPSSAASATPVAPPAASTRSTPDTSGASNGSRGWP
jgi:hypothetical protein